MDGDPPSPGSRYVDRVRDLCATLIQFSGALTGGPAIAAFQRKLWAALGDSRPLLLVTEDMDAATFVAQITHLRTTAADTPFKPIDCRDPIQEIGNELFEIEGTVQLRRFGGVLTLLCPTEMPASLRVNLLRELQLPGAPRLVAVSTGFPELPRMKRRREGELLYWMSKGNVIEIPPLKHRREDIPAMVRHLISRTAGGSNLSVSPTAMMALMDTDWTCIAELVEAVHGAVGKAATEQTITFGHLPDRFQDHAIGPGSLLQRVMSATERSVIRTAVAEHQGRTGKTAEALGIPERTLRRKLREHDINKDEFRPRKRVRSGLVKFLPLKP